MGAFFRVVAWVLAILTGSAGVLLIIVGAFPGLQGSARWLAMASSFVPYGILLWITTLTLVLVSTRGGYRLLALIPVVALCLQAVWVHDYLPGRPPAGTASGLRVTAFNTLYGKADPDGTASALAQARADIIVLTEASAPLVESAPMTQVLQDYPYRVGRLAPGYVVSGEEDPTATYVASKRPLQLVEQLDTLHDQYVIETTTRDDVPVVLLAAHPTNVIPGTTEWIHEADVVAATIAAHQDRPLIVVGDLNATPENLTYQIISDAGVTGAAAQAGAGWVPTFDPVMGLPALIPIDHVLVNDLMSAQYFSTFAVAGSDHRGVVASVSVR